MLEAELAVAVVWWEPQLFAVGMSEHVVPAIATGPCHCVARIKQACMVSDVDIFRWARWTKSHILVLYQSHGSYYTMFAFKDNLKKSFLEVFR